MYSLHSLEVYYWCYLCYKLSSNHVAIVDNLAVTDHFLRHQFMPAGYFFAPTVSRALKNFSLGITS